MVGGLVFLLQSFQKVPPVFLDFFSAFFDFHPIFYVDAKGILVVSELLLRLKGLSVSHSLILAIDIVF